jgi:ferredoxin
VPVGSGQEPEWDCRAEPAATTNESIVMATPSLRLPESVPGPFYVTSECTDCDMCRETAPTIFRRHEEIGYSIVFHQPETEAERGQAMEGLQGCPVEAIGCEA